MTQDNLHLLMVEDNAGDAAITHHILAETVGADFHITHVRTAQRALSHLKNETFSAVILDLNLPDSQGLDTLRLLRAASPRSAFVVVSGLVDDAFRARAREEGAEEVISKDEANSRLFALSLLYVVERNRAEAHRRRLERLFEISPDAIVVIDAHGQVKYVNEAALQLFGRTREGFAQENLGFSSRDGEPVELRVPNAEGERIGEMRVIDFDWDGERAFLASIRDVTEKKNMELQLMMADRMTSIGMLAAGVAHEINNPLTCVVANLELAATHVDALPRSALAATDLKHEIRDAREAAARARQIVRDLRVFSRSEVEQTGPVDVHRVIESTLRVAVAEIRHKARIVKDFGKVPPVEASESRLGQVILNLVVNAAQAISGDPEEHEIRIATRTTDDGSVEVAVADTGPGIPAYLRKRLFTPFFTTKPAGMGTGLGLAICQRIVTSFGGEIRFDSEVGSGTRFIVTLPRARVTAPPPAPAAQPGLATTDGAGALPAPHRAKVLIIDDDAMVTFVAERALNGEHAVTTCDNAVEALGLIREGQHFDVILCDLMMPKMSGPEFFDQVCALGNGAARKVVFMTGGAFTPSARSFLDRVRNHRIEKPFDIQGLRAVVNGMVR